MIAYLAVILGSLALSLALTPLSVRLGVRLVVVARPGGRRRHVGIIPRLGGLAVLVAFVGGAAISLAGT